MTLQDDLFICGIFQAVLTGVMFVVAAGCRFARPKTSNGGPPPWEQVSLSLPDLLGVAVILKGVNQAKTSITLGYNSYELSKYFFGVWGVTFFTSFSVAMIVVINSTLSHERTLRALTLSTVTGRKLKDDGVVGKAARRKAPSDMALLILRALAVAFLSSCFNGAIRVPELGILSGPTDIKSRDWVTRGSIVCSMLRNMVWTLVLVLEQPAIVTPGLMISSLSCLTCSLVAIAVEAVGTPGSDFSEGSSPGALKVEDYAGVLRNTRTLPTSRRETGTRKGKGKTVDPERAAAAASHNHRHGRDDGQGQEGGIFFTRDGRQAMRTLDRLEVEVLRRFDPALASSAHAFEMISLLEKLAGIGDQPAAALAGMMGALKLRGEPGTGKMFHRKGYVGRAKELEEVMATVKKLVAGDGELSGRGLLLIGDSGIGKTTFIEALRHEMADYSPIFATYTCPTRPCLASFSAVGSIVRSLLETLSIRPGGIISALPNLPAQSRSLLSLLTLAVPEVIASETAASRMKLGQKAIFTAMASLIVEVLKCKASSFGVVVIVLENAQKLPQVASAANLPLFLMLTSRRHVANRPTPPSSRFEFPYRPARDPTSPLSNPQQQKIDHLLSSAVPHVTRVYLEGLSDDEGRQLIRQNLDAHNQLPDDLVATIAERLGGSPLRMELWVKGLLLSLSPGKGEALPAAREIMESARLAMTLRVEVSDRLFLMMERESQEFMSLMAVIGMVMDVEAMYYVYAAMCEDPRVEKFINLMKRAISSRIFYRMPKSSSSIKKHTNQPRKPAASLSPPSAGAPTASTSSLTQGRSESQVEVPSYDDVQYQWTHEYLMEAFAKKVGGGRRIQAHAVLVKFWMTRMAKKDDRVTDTVTQLEVAYHLERSSSKGIATFFLVLAAEQDMKGSPMLTRRDILILADSLSYRQHPAGPVDPPRPPIAPDATRDLLHGTIEYLLARSGATLDATSHANYLWNYGSECIGRFITLPKQGSEISWEIAGFSLLGVINQPGYRSKTRGGDAEGHRRLMRRAASLLHDITPLIGLNVDASLARAMHHFGSSCILLESNGGSVGELLVGYGWIQHHLAVTRKFSVRELVIRKGRAMIAAMSADEMAKRRGAVAMFEGLIGMGFTAVGSFAQAEAFLASSTLLGDAVAMGYPLAELHIWHITTLIQMGRLKDACRLTRESRHRLAGDDSADVLTRRVLDALHVLIVLMLGHGTQNNGMTSETIELAEELISKTLPNLPKLKSSVETSNGDIAEEEAAYATGMNTSTGTAARSPTGSPCQHSETRKAQASSLGSDTLYSDSSLYVQAPMKCAEVPDQGPPPTTASRTIFLAVLSLIATLMEKPNAAATLLDAILYPPQQPSNGASATLSPLGLIFQPAGGLPPHGASCGVGGMSGWRFHNPLLASWVPGIPFAIACAAEASVRCLTRLPSPGDASGTAAEARKGELAAAQASSRSGIQRTPSSASGSVAGGAPTVLSGFGRAATVIPPSEWGSERLECWKVRVIGCFEIMRVVALKLKTSEHLAAEMYLMKSVVRDWELGGISLSRRNGTKGSKWALALIEVARYLEKAKDAARAYQKLWVEGQVHAHADAILGDGTGAGGPGHGFEDHRMFEEECGAMIRRY
ncbi:hypothetical protein HK101_001253 [Irineochytrium annulatum]|nr:hypothetical protein HK101_001253 [Irineochytrium annulatum]